MEDVKASKTPEGPKRGVKASEVIIDELPSEEIPTHALSAREQLMRQWPTHDWELR